ncbi:WXG100 family type VII secretion target [Streptomyces sp. TE33382]
MSHEQMLAWLDQANSGAVQGAADRLLSAATEIRKIAEDLKIRPQMVEWKGEGADAFRTWSADLANSTLRLGDYSEGASKWLARASDAIATAQVAIPRTHAGAAANLAAAKEARNDPDASAVAREAADTLIANKEANRQEAAAQMRKLAESYAFSSSQMKGMEKPAFPPPPAAIAPPVDKVLGEGGEEGRGARLGAAVGGLGSVPGPQAQSIGDLGGVTAPPTSVDVVGAPVRPTVAQPVDMGIDSVATLPDPSTLPPTTTPSVPSPGRPETGLPTSPTVFPNVGPVAPPTTSGGGRGLPKGIRPPMPPVGPTNVNGPGVRPPGPSIVGGRQVPQNPGRPMGGLPRSPVIGNEGTHAGRGAMGHGPAMGGTGGGQSGIVGGRRLASETGGMVGGRPQQPGQAKARPFTPGGTGLVRGSAAASQRPGDSRRDENGSRPDYLTEDEETWQQGGRRIGPPVID